MSAALARLAEAAHAADGDDRAWLERLLHAARPALDAGLGVLGFFYDMAKPEEPRLRSPAFVGTPAGTADAFDRLERNAPRAFMQVLVRPMPSCSTLSDRLGLGDGMFDLPLHKNVLAPLGIADFLSIAATDASGAGCLVGAPLPRVTAMDTLDVDLWTAVAGHLTTAIRRRNADRAAAQAALPVWAALVAGRWTLVDAFDRRGSRFLVARKPKGDPVTPSDATSDPLTPREREVVERAATGQSNKVIAYELAVASSTVAGHLAKAAAKLGARSRVELITAFLRSSTSRGDRATISGCFDAPRS